MNVKELIFGGGVKTSAGGGAWRDSIQAWLPIKNIVGGVVVTRDNRFIKILEVLPVNIYLKSPNDRQNIISSYASWLKIAPDNIQLEARTLPADTAAYVDRMKEYEEREENESCREMIQDNIAEIGEGVASDAIRHRFFLIFQYEVSMKAKRNTTAGIIQRLNLSVLNESGNKSRHEKRFLIESICHLMYGGLLVYVIPYYRLTPDICRVLMDNFEGLTVWRFTDSEFKKFKQIAVLGLRKRRADVPEDTLWLEKYTVNPAAIPSLTEIPEDKYPLPAQSLEVTTFKGEKFNEKELEQQLRRCDSFSQLMARSELDKGTKRPLLPLSISQIGLIGGSGMINGLIECDTPHIIKGRIIKVTRLESEDRYSANGRHIGDEIHETISNKMIFNVLTPQGFRALT